MIPHRPGASVGVGHSGNPFRYVWGMGIASETRHAARELRSMASELERSDVFHEAGLDAAKVIADAMVHHLGPISRSGNLAGTVRVVAPTRRSGHGLQEDYEVAAHVVVGGPQAPYAGVIQGGWPKHGIPAYPFMTWAINDSQGEVGRIIQKSIDKLDNKYQRRIAAARFLSAGMASSYAHPARYLARAIQVEGAQYAQTTLRSFLAGEVAASRAGRYSLRSPTSGRFVSRQAYQSEVTEFVGGLVG